MTRYSYWEKWARVDRDELVEVWRLLVRKIGSSSSISDSLSKGMNDVFRTVKDSILSETWKVPQARNWTFSKGKSNLGDWYFQHDSRLHRMEYYQPSLESFAKPCHVCVHMGETIIRIHLFWTELKRLLPIEFGQVTRETEVCSEDPINLKWKRICRGKELTI